MEWHEVELDGSRTVAFPERAIPGIGQKPEDGDTDKFLGGIIRSGQWGWVTRRYSSDANLIVCNMSTGDCVSWYSFWNEGQGHGQRSSIRCVEELFTGQPDRTPLLAICLESWDNGERFPINCPKARTQVLIYSIAKSRVLRHFELQRLYCSTLKFLDQSVCGGTQLCHFDGCLAVASEEGVVLLVDLNYSSLLETAENSNLRNPNSEGEPGYGQLHCLPCDGVSQLEVCRSQGAHLAVRLDVSSSGIRTLMGISLIFGFAAGLEDGTVLIYDLEHFQVTTTLKPAGNKGKVKGAVTKMCVIMPPDDPKPCFYICALYEGTDGLNMLLHSVNYRRSYMDQESYEFHVEHFQSSSVRNQQVFDGGICSVLACFTASTFSFAGDSGTLLIGISWHSISERKNKFVLFDINQWYKDEMPAYVRRGEIPHYIVGYVLSGLPMGLDLHLKPSTIMHYVSLQRYDEHFYPNSLTFDCKLLTSTGSRYYAQDGVQHRFLNALRWERATLFLRPQPYHEHIVKLRLLPQFCELNATFSKTAMYEVILSVALEHNCGALLNDCARSWLDGSFLCNMLDPTELSPLTLTNWIVKRAGQIKTRCDELCQGIFDYGGYSLDERERREFQVLSDQLRELLRLQSYILELGQRRLMPNTLDDCKNNERALKTVVEYQRVLYWFIEQGLLPEGQQEDHREQREEPLVRLRHVYSQRRAQRKRLYIDSLKKLTSLSERYPPDSLHALLHVMLDLDTELSNKHALVLYLLMDLDPKLGKTFQTSFQLENDLVKSVRSFWCLDRGDNEQCVKELYDGPTPASNYKVWQMRLLLDTLVQNGAVVEAMQVANQPPGPLSAELHLKVLLANECMPEAFMIARNNDDDEGKSLLEPFFRHCISRRRFKILAELLLRGPEERLLYRLLRECGSRQTDCVQLILLLQKNKLVEAVSFMDDAAAERERENEASNNIIAAYRSTLAPVAQKITKNLRIPEAQDDGKSGGPLPFSCQMVKQNASGQIASIFQSSAIIPPWATYIEESPTLPAVSSPGNISCTNLGYDKYGFLEFSHRRRPVKPVPHQVVEKRMREEEQQKEERERSQQYVLQPRKRRRLLAEQLVDDVKGHIRSILDHQSEQLKLEQSERNKASDLLQPIKFFQPRQAATRQSSSSPQSIHTILKRNSAMENVSGTPPVATSTTLTGSKRFRFMPPIPLESKEVDSEDAVEEDDSEEEEETDEIIVEIESRSEARNASSTESDEDEEFLSPLASANVSLVDQLPRESPRPLAPPAGPQPRSSLLFGRTGISSGIGTATSSGSSSGFVSFVTVEPTQTTSHSQFVPTVCSSKMGETQSQVFSSASSVVKISERTTICGEMESTDLGSELTAAPSSQWSLPTARPPVQGHQMMDTTLGMSTYELASPEQQDTQNQDEEELKLGDTQSLEEQRNQQDGQETSDQLTFLGSSEAPAQEPLLSPAYSLSSEESDLSSADIRNPLLPTLQNDDPMYSIVVESTGSITTSRSVTQTPTSFLPSDTNVSQTSSPRAPHGGDGDGSPLSLYRANSLETVDDLDTTKGSVEEEEEYDEDDCVIALDGTEVRGYVAPSQQTAACSSAELFAFKDDCQEEVASGPCPSLSLGATVNSDSEVAGTIAMDSDEESPKAKDDQSKLQKEDEWPMEENAGSNDSVATVSFSEYKQSLAVNNMEHVVKEELDQGMDQEVEKDMDQEVDQKVDKTVDQDVDQEVDQKVDKTVDQEVDQDVKHKAQQVMEPEVDQDVEKEVNEEIELVVEEEVDQELELLQTGHEVHYLDKISEEDEEEAEEQNDKRKQEAGEEAKEEVKAEKKEEAEAKIDPEPLLVQEEDSRDSLMLVLSEDEEPVVLATSSQRRRRSTSVLSVTPRNLRPRRTSTEHKDSPVPATGLKMRLRNNDAITSSHVATPPVPTPKRRSLANKHVLEVINEQSSLDVSLPRTRSRTRLSMESTEATNSRSSTPTNTTRSKRATSLAPATDNPAVRRSLRSNSEPRGVAAVQPVTRQRKAAGARSRKTSNSEGSNSASTAQAEVTDLEANHSGSRSRTNSASSTGSATKTRELRLRAPRRSKPDV
ncbi:protein ELYS homolog [Drosophila eugracilis]|uniref:protein ELYS homolog n=1 Tax=Drosophila eugracilis TaxID=29029 RepID=UPI0007E860A7|nr:protein ELYS homolog [Drosophila eugracilis]